MWPNPQETVDLVTFTEEILNGKLFFTSFYSLYLSVSDTFQSMVSFDLIPIVLLVDFVSKKKTEIPLKGLIFG